MRNPTHDQKKGLLYQNTLAVLWYALVNPCIRPILYTSYGQHTTVFTYSVLFYKKKSQLNFSSFLIIGKVRYNRKHILCFIRCDCWRWSQYTQHTSHPLFSLSLIYLFIAHLPTKTVIYTNFGNCHIQIFDKKYQNFIKNLRHKNRVHAVKLAV